VSGPEASIDPRAALFIYVSVSAIAVVAILAVAALLRERLWRGGRDRVYESGVIPARSAGRPYNAPYFLIAAFFVIFDMEAAILFGWAVSVREAGLVGLIEAAVFIGVLLAALAYIWLDGALEWGPDGARREDAAGAGPPSTEDG